ncbi:hypothetical protein IV454_19605 [Massilia antarctica]|uniref:Uncharacterized protein n=1 Tax=Massilia antarctica TaxID=2765360 RepID=A0AA49A609_9BURK|nr:hypothetical protein [Massilia antarctica]QPI47779.1 hypothetical protein IV454_19605 [Massilia antarctica]
MNNKNLEIKIIQQSQRRNFNKFLTEEVCESLKKSIIQAIYFPISSDILQKILSMLKIEKLKKETIFENSNESIDEKILLAIRNLPNLQKLLCFFPNYSPTKEHITSQFPILEIQRTSAEDWYRLNVSKRDRMDFFFCIAPDLSCGMVMDIYAGHPYTSGSDAPIYDIYSWNF